MTSVFFLLLTHLALGLLAMLPFVPARAGVKFFKFTSGCAAFMTTAALGLLYRRFHLGGGGAAPGGALYPVLLLTVVAFLILTVAYNRAQHLEWTALAARLLAAAIVTGLIALVLAPGSERTPLVVATDLASVLLLGAATSAMILGHWYLVVLDLPIAPLKRLTVLLVAGLVLRALLVGICLARPLSAGYEDARLVVTGVFSPDGVFVWMRILFGIVGPLSIIWFIWKTVQIRSTQSATGILYVQLFLILSGELLAKYLRVTAGIPL